MKHLTILSGLPTSGKSTYAKFEFAQLDVPTKDIRIPCHRCDGDFFFDGHINDFEIVGNVAD